MIVRGLIESQDKKTVPKELSKIEEEPLLMKR